MKRLIRFVLLPAIAALAGCALGPSLEARRAVVDHAKSLAVVTAVGRQALVQFYGLTIFTNFDHSADVGAWGVDRAIQETTLHAVPKHLTVKSIEYAPDLEQTYYLPVGGRGLRSGSHSDQQLAAYVDKVMQRSSVDLVLFVLPGNYPALRISNGKKSWPLGIVDVPITILLMDARTKQEVYAKDHFPHCNEVAREFEYRQETMARQLEQRRTELTRRWLSCFSIQLTEFVEAFDGRCTVGSCY